MGLFDFFRPRAPAATALRPIDSLTQINAGVFVIGLDGQMYADASGRVTDVQLAAGATEVLGAGRMVISEGRIIAISNESAAYKPSLEQMRKVVRHLDSMEADLSGNGSGVLVLVFKHIDESGVGSDGVRYWARKVDGSVDLVPV